MPSLTLLTICSVVSPLGKVFKLEHSWSDLFYKLPPWGMWQRWLSNTLGEVLISEFWGATSLVSLEWRGDGFVVQVAIVDCSNKNKPWLSLMRSLSLGIMDIVVMTLLTMSSLTLPFLSAHFLHLSLCPTEWSRPWGPLVATQQNCLFPHQDSFIHKTSFITFFPF